MHTMYKLYAHYVAVCADYMKLVTWGCISAQVTVAFNEFSRCSLLTTSCEKPARMVWGPLDPFCDCQFWGRWCTTLHVTPPTPKMTG